MHFSDSISILQMRTLRLREITNTADLRSYSRIITILTTEGGDPVGNYEGSVGLNIFEKKTS